MSAGTDITIVADALIQVERKRVILAKVLGCRDLELEFYRGPNNEELCDLIFDLVGLLKDSDDFRRDGVIDLFYELIETDMDSMDILNKLIDYKYDVENK